MGQCPNPRVELLNLFQLAALGEVPRMDEYVPIRYVELDVRGQGVGIRHADHSGFVGSHRGGGWLHGHLDHPLRLANLPPGSRGILAQRMYWHLHFGISEIIHSELNFSKWNK